ncbi:S-layer protein [uncultured archaeon]|nr:S-layer protein [uncultured archaeon]
MQEANENYVYLSNKDNAINLAQNSVQPLYGDLKFKVADSSTALRFYPLFEKTAPGIYEIRGVVFDSSATPYNTTTSWDARMFPGFWYNFGGGKYTETLKIVNQDASNLTVNSRVIGEKNLQYNTSRSDQKFCVFSEKNKKVENGLEYNSTTKTFTLNATGGYYARLGWFGNLYVALNGKTNKLAKLIKEQKKDEKQTLKVGTPWNLGEGYELTVKALDTSTSPRQATLIFTKDGKTLDKKVVKEGDVYTYIEKSVSGENNVPVFVTYVESIFSSGEALVQLRYTWLISQNVLEIKAGDEFGVFKVQEANENYVLLFNEDNPINLAQNSVQPLYGDLKFKVADSSTALRFYPYIEQTITAPVVEEKASAQATTPQQTVAPADSPAVSEPAGAESLEPVQPIETATPSTTTALPIQWNWVLFAIVGLIVGYLVLKRD